MGRPTRPESVRTVQKVLLIDRLEKHGDCTLQQLVFRGRDADWTGFFARSFRDVHAPDRWRKIGPRLRTIQQRLQVGFEVLPIIRYRPAIMSGGAVFAQSPVRLA
jgi:hypothetical protein